MYTTKDGKLWLHNSNENLITQAFSVGNTNNNQIITINNIQGELREGDIVSGQGVTNGTFIVNITTGATTFIQVNSPQTIQNNTQLSFSSLARNKFYGINSNSNITFVFRLFMVRDFQFSSHLSSHNMISIPKDL